jgi:hypothetical protein
MTVPLYKSKTKGADLDHFSTFPFEDIVLWVEYGLKNETTRRYKLNRDGPCVLHEHQTNSMK